MRWVNTIAAISLLGSLYAAPSVKMKSVEEVKPRVDEIVKKLTRKEKINIIGTGTDHNIEREGRDIPFQLPNSQHELIKAVLEVNKNVVVVNVTGTGVDMSSFADEVPAIVQAFFPGEHGGEAIGEVLTGKTNPSGKLPFTLGRKAEDHHWFGNYLPKGGKLYRRPIYTRNGASPWKCHYNEGILNDYRWFEAKKIEPLFPFGYGLSYTSFKLGNLKVSKKKRHVYVSVTVKNSGSRDGAEAVQVYVEDVKCSEIRPPKELKQFAKVKLKAGEKRTITLKLDSDAFKFWSEKEKAWKLEHGEFKIHVGTSSRDIKATTKIRL